MYLNHEWDKCEVTIIHKNKYERLQLIRYIMHYNDCSLQVLPGRLRFLEMHAWCKERKRRNAVYGDYLTLSANRLLEYKLIQGFLIGNVQATHFLNEFISQCNYKN